MPEPTEIFEAWLLHRVAEAVEGAEVTAALLTDLHAAIGEVRARPLRRGTLWRSWNSPSGSTFPWATSRNAWRPCRRNRPWCGKCSSADASRRRWSSHEKNTRQTTTEGMMAKVLGGRQAVPLEDGILAQASQLKALTNVLER